MKIFNNSHKRKIYPIFIGVLLCALSLISNPYTLTSVFAQSVASFSWSSPNISMNIGQTQSVTLFLNTGGQETTGTDVEISYEPSRVEITNLAFSNPTLYPQNFHTINEAGKKLSFHSTYTDVSGLYKGSGSYVTITLKGKVAGNTGLNIVCGAGATNDTNVIQKGTGNDIVNCGSVANLGVTVNSSSSPTNSPTASPTQVPSNNQCSALNSRPSGFTATAQSSSSIILRFTKEPNSTYYTLKYGTKAGSYQYGASNIGNVNAFMVNYLSPNTTYYFALAGVNACSTGPYITAQAKTLSAGSPAVVTYSTPRATIRSTQPTTIAQATLPPEYKEEPQVINPDEQIPSFDNYLSETPLPFADENLFGAKPTPVTNGSQAGKGTPGWLAPLSIGFGILLLLILLIVFIKKRQEKQLFESVIKPAPAAPQAATKAKETPAPEEVSPDEILKNEPPKTVTQ